MLLFISNVPVYIRLYLRFNTSHVTLYQGESLNYQNSSRSFNTSHVTLYPKSPTLFALSILSFNTSHVTLYLCSHQSLSLVFLFQYISCYSLSLYFTAFLTPNIFIIPQNTMHCKIFTRRLDNSLFWD